MRFAPQSRIHLAAPFALAVWLSTTWPNKLNERVAKTILSAKLNRKANDREVLAQVRLWVADGPRVASKFVMDIQ